MAGAAPAASAIDGSVPCSSASCTASCRPVACSASALLACWLRLARVHVTIARVEGLQLLGRQAARVHLARDAVLGGDENHPQQPLLLRLLRRCRLLLACLDRRLS
eukprot:scaffold744_cov370-Prasinococcus_capsulatus_cf.AAC.18